MKKVLLALLLSSGVAFANEEDANQIETMQNMETAMAFIQKGFLYNNDSMITKGLHDLTSHSQNIKSFVINDKVVKDGDFNPRRYARNEARVITNLAEDTLKSYQSGSKTEAVTSYNKILSRCLACHKIIRKW
jgi:hypothetical protein